jgi:hypothetical protein
MLRPLPRPLSAWADELARFSADSSAVLGPWLPALERLLGPFARADPADDGEPDGFQGLGRRGRYERLALSEWGLLDAAPDEFLRRAGSGEHLFHQIGRTTRRGGRRIIALFDAGPLQLGSPRLAHLAWLLVLARRAQRAGVQLQWGVLQAPGRGLRGEADAPAVRALLAARSLAMMAPDHLAAWAAQLGPPAAEEERWLVSSAGARRAAGALAAGSLGVDESPAPDAAALVIEVGAAAGRARALLPLPSSRRCAQLLRDPFPVDVAPTRRRAEDVTLAAGAQIAFTASGTHLVARLASGDVVGLAIPRREAGPVWPVARYAPRAGEEVVAAGWRKGRMHVLTAVGGVLHVNHLKTRRWRRSAPCHPPRGAPAPLSSPARLAPLFVDGDARLFVFCDAAWRLHRGPLDGGQAEILSQRALACVWSRGAAVSLERIETGELGLRMHRRDSRDLAARWVVDARASDAFVVLDGRGTPALAVAGWPGGRWRLFRPPHTGPVVLDVPAETPVFGAAVWQDLSCLLVRGAGGDSLELVSSRGNQARFGFSGQIDHACLSPDTQLIAVQIAGGVQVIDRSGTVRLRYGGGRP